MKSALNALPQYVVATVTQGGADTFATTRIETGISTAGRYAWMLDRCEFYLPTQISAAAAADSSLNCGLSQGTAPASAVAPSSSDFICRASLQINLAGTAANLSFVDGERIWIAPENFVVVDPSLNFFLASTATGQTLSATLRIWYWPIELSEMDILRMIALR